MIPVHGPQAMFLSILVARPSYSIALYCNIGNCCYCRTRWPRCCALVLLGSHQKGSGVSCSPGRHAFPLPLLDDPYLHPGRLLNDIMKNVEPVCSNSQHAVRTTTRCLSPFLFCEVEEIPPRTGPRGAMLSLLH